VNVNNIYIEEEAVGIAARLDDIGKPAWIALMILGFIFFWPVGLAVLAFLIWSGRMGCWKHRGHGRWHNEGIHEAAGRWLGGERRQATSGNRAFDDYRADTLRRLEEEQREFLAFLDRLRFAKDKAEFDQFLAERRGPEAPQQPPAQG
jgi:Protein of unknown function (DUF2852)